MDRPIIALGKVITRPPPLGLISKRPLRPYHIPRLVVFGFSIRPQVRFLSCFEVTRRRSVLDVLHPVLLTTVEALLRQHAVDRDALESLDAGGVVGAERRYGVSLQFEGVDDMAFAFAGDVAVVLWYNSLRCSVVYPFADCVNGGVAIFLDVDGGERG